MLAEIMVICAIRTWRESFGDLLPFFLKFFQITGGKRIYRIFTTEIQYMNAVSRQMNLFSGEKFEIP